MLGLRDVDERHHQPLDGVARGAIRPDSHRVPGAVRRRHLLLQRTQALQHAPGVREKIRVVEQGGQVGQRASHVGIDQSRHVPRLRRESLHPQQVVEEDGRDLDVVHQVQQVVVRLLERLELLRELRVHGVELLVEGLRLLLGGLELLVGALELLVDGLHLLVRGGELLVGE